MLYCPQICHWLKVQSQTHDTRILVSAFLTFFLLLIESKVQGKSCIKLGCSSFRIRSSVVRQKDHRLLDPAGIQLSPTLLWDQLRLLTPLTFIHSFLIGKIPIVLSRLWFKIMANNKEVSRSIYRGHCWHEEDTQQSCFLFPPTSCLLTNLLSNSDLCEVHNPLVFTAGTPVSFSS